MSPVFRRESEYTFKIYSNEEVRMHIHVLYNGKEAKYWLEPQVELAKNTGIPEHKLNEIKKIVEKSRQLTLGVLLNVIHRMVYVP